MYHTKNLAKKMSEDQNYPSKVNICGWNNEIAIIGSISVKLKSFGMMYQGLLADTEKTQRELFGGVEFEDEEWFSFKVPEIIADEPNCLQPGYFLGDHEFNDLNKYEDAGLNILLNHPRLSDCFAFVCGEGKVVLNIVACHDFLRCAEQAHVVMFS